MKTDLFFACFSGTLAVVCLGCALFIPAARHQFFTAALAGIFAFANYIEYKSKKAQKQQKFNK